MEVRASPTGDAGVQYHTMSLIVVIGVVILIAGIYGLVRYYRTHRPLALAYAALSCYSMGMLLLWASYELRDDGRAFSFLPRLPRNVNAFAGFELLLDFAWLSIVGTGMFLLLSLRAYTKRRVDRAIERIDPVDRLDLLPTSPKKRRKKRRRSKWRENQRANQYRTDLKEDGDAMR